MLHRTARPTISIRTPTSKTVKEVPREKAAAQKERLGFKAEWQWLCHKLWNVEAGTRKSGVTRYSREKDTKQQINLKRIM